MKRIWKRLRSERGNRVGASLLPRGIKNKGTAGAATISSREAVRRFRAHALEEKGHNDVVRLGLKDAFWSDFYHHTLTASWPAFTLGGFITYVVINLFFAFLYGLVPGQISAPHPPSLLDLFFFSVQTLSTVGYGVMAPSGPVANTIVSFEVLLGMMINALATGIVFARFARPRSRIMFGTKAVISDENGVSALCVRIANCRRSMILSLDVEVALSRLLMTANGHLVREFQPLQLVQAHVPILRFAFVLAHVINDESPLNRYTHAALEDDEAEIVVTVTGTDEATGQTVFARTAYGFDRIAFNHRFVDIIHSRSDGGVAVDYSRFHDVEEHTTPDSLP